MNLITIKEKISDIQIIEEKLNYYRSIGYKTNHTSFFKETDSLYFVFILTKRISENDK